MTIQSGGFASLRMAGRVSRRHRQLLRNSRRRTSEVLCKLPPVKPQLPFPAPALLDRSGQSQRSSQLLLCSLLLRLNPQRRRSLAHTKSRTSSPTARFLPPLPTQLSSILGQSPPAELGGSVRRAQAAVTPLRQPQHPEASASKWLCPRLPAPRRACLPAASPPGARPE